MKTALSIPDEVFEAAERLARQTKKSRSRFFTDAVKEYVARHATDDITDSINNVCAQLGGQKDEFLSVAAHRTLSRSEW